MVNPELANLLKNLSGDIDQLQQDLDDLEQEVNNLIGGGTQLGDDAKLLFGDDFDFAQVYDSSEDRFEFINQRTGNIIFHVLAAVGTGATLTLENGDIKIKSDGGELIFGQGDDVGFRFDDGADDLRWRDRNNSADRIAIDRTTGNLRMTGELTEGAAL